MKPCAPLSLSIAIAFAPPIEPVFASGHASASVARDRSGSGDRCPHLETAAPRHAGVPVKKGNALVGAIRWDGWYRGSPYVSVLAPDEWRYRHPFYARTLADGQLEAFSDSQEVMDQEIAYAAAGGIDFWIFNMYVLRDPQGNPLVDPTNGWKAEDMNRSRKYYLSSQLKSKVKFSLMMGMPGSGDYYFGQHNWDFEVQEAIGQMQEPSYQRVMRRRPLVFFWLAGEDPEKILGSWRKLRQMLDDFRKKARRAGMKNPYIAALVWSADEGERAVAELGVNAVTSYTSPIPGGYEDPDNYTWFPYDALAQADSALWNSFRDAGLKAIPTVSAGWDPRPHRDDVWGYGGYTSGPVVEYATAEQIATHLGEGVQWIRGNPASAEASTIIMYAWNELSEGGWIVPTHSEGTTRLDAIRQVLRPGQ
ncbi:MAG: hypothetical protein HYX75_22800 [Acidobacteria bacterium]|nr:hypothetical protein [Acidobacteriota bacterium]